MTKVIMRFRDKETKAIHEAGDKYEGKAERVAELQKLGYLEVAKPKKKVKPKEGE